MDKKGLIKPIVNYLKQKNVKVIGFFGSFARNEMSPESDIDVLVEYLKGTTLFDIVRMHLELGELTGKKIDLVSKNAVSPDLMKYINKDLELV